MATGRDRVAVAVGLVTLLAVLARLVGLGSRPFHWAEARVGYWTLRYVETGRFWYRPVAGGPLPYLLDRWVFALLGPSDFAARLPVALTGGLAPLVALTFRDVLDDLETITFAALLALSPPLLYYSRFLRGDAMLATFGLATVGFVHRWRVAGDRRALYAGAVALALATASSAFVLVYAACWLVAAWLTFDRLRVRGIAPAAVTAEAERLWARFRAAATPLARSLFVALGVGVVLFARRPTLTTAPLAALSDAVVGVPTRFVGVRVLGRQFHGAALIPFLSAHVEVLLAASLAVVLLGVAGAARVRYSATDRPTVAFATFWAGASVLFVPMAASVSAPWTTVHTVAPLAVPAAVGGAWLLRGAREAVAAADAGRTLAALLVLAALGGHLGVGVAGVYGDGGALVQYGQPADDLEPAMTAASDAIADNDGVDVLYVGPDVYAPNEEDLSLPPVRGANADAFARRLPLSWYVERTGATTDSVRSAAELPASPPPVVVATDETAESVATQLGDGYVAFELETAQSGRELTVFVSRG